MLAVLSVLIAQVEHVPLFPRYEFEPFHLALALGALALAVGFMWPRWKKAVEKGNRVVFLFSSETRLHFALWIGVCLAAGIGEELTYRGVLTTLLERLSGNVTIAVMASALLFGVVHMVQGWKSSAVIVLFALGFQALALATGSLYVAMAVHVVYDLIAGARYTQLSRAKRERDAAAAVPTAS
jgi:membrane protease YdiL (CAAX protease family)